MGVVVLNLGLSMLNSSVVVQLHYVELLLYLIDVVAFEKQKWTGNIILALLSYCQDVIPK